MFFHVQTFVITVIASILVARAIPAEERVADPSPKDLLNDVALAAAEQTSPKAWEVRGNGQHHPTTHVQLDTSLKFTVEQATVGHMREGVFETTERATEDDQSYDWTESCFDCGDNQAATQSPYHDGDFLFLFLFTGGEQPLFLVLLALPGLAAVFAVVYVVCVVVSTTRVGDAIKEKASLTHNSSNSDGDGDGGLVVEDWCSVALEGTLVREEQERCREDGGLVLGEEDGFVSILDATSVLETIEEAAQEEEEDHEAEAVDPLVAQVGEENVSVEVEHQEEPRRVRFVEEPNNLSQVQELPITSVEWRLTNSLWFRLCSRSNACNDPMHLTQELQLLSYTQERNNSEGYADALACLFVRLLRSGSKYYPCMKAYLKERFHACQDPLFDRSREALGVVLEAYHQHQKQPSDSACREDLFHALHSLFETAMEATSGGGREEEEGSLVPCIPKSSANFFANMVRKAVENKEEQRRLATLERYKQKWNAAKVGVVEETRKNLEEKKNEELAEIGMKYDFARARQYSPLETIRQETDVGEDGFVSILDGELVLETIVEEDTVALAMEAWEDGKAQEEDDEPSDVPSTVPASPRRRNGKRTTPSGFGTSSFKRRRLTNAVTTFTEDGVQQQRNYLPFPRFPLVEASFVATMARITDEYRANQRMRLAQEHNKETEQRSTDVSSMAPASPRRRNGKRQTPSGFGTSSFKRRRLTNAVTTFTEDGVQQQRNYLPFPRFPLVEASFVATMARITDEYRANQRMKLAQEHNKETEQRSTDVSSMAPASPRRRNGKRQTPSGFGTSSCKRRRLTDAVTTFTEEGVQQQRNYLPFPRFPLVEASFVATMARITAEYREHQRTYLPQEDDKETEHRSTDVPSIGAAEREVSSANSSDIPKFPANFFANMVRSAAENEKEDDRNETETENRSVKRRRIVSEDETEVWKTAAAGATKEFQWGSTVKNDVGVEQREEDCGQQEEDVGEDGFASILDGYSVLETIVEEDTISLAMEAWADGKADVEDRMQLFVEGWKRDDWRSNDVRLSWLEPVLDNIMEEDEVDSQEDGLESFDDGTVVDAVEPWEEEDLAMDLPVEEILDGDSDGDAHEGNIHMALRRSARIAAMPPVEYYSNNRTGRGGGVVIHRVAHGRSRVYLHRAAKEGEKIYQ